MGKTGVKKGDNCATCICDVGQAIEDMKKILIRKTDLLSKISVYDCAKFNDIGDQIVITNANLESLPRHYSEIEETKGRKYIDEEEIESALKRGVGRESGMFPNFILFSCFLVSLIGYLKITFHVFDNFEEI